jgi:hypothetical protein
LGLPDGTAYGGRLSTSEVDVVAKMVRGLRKLGFVNEKRAMSCTPTSVATAASRGMRSRSSGSTRSLGLAKNSTNHQAGGAEGTTKPTWGGHSLVSAARARSWRRRFEAYATSALANGKRATAHAARAHVGCDDVESLMRAALERLTRNSWEKAP